MHRTPLGSARIALGLAVLACAVPMAVPLTVLLTAPLAVPRAQAMGVRSPAPPPAQADFVPDEVIVRFRPQVSAAALAALLRELGLVIRKPLGPERAYLLGITDGSAVPAMVERLQARAEVESAAPNRISRLNPPLPPQPIRKPE